MSRILFPVLVAATLILASGCQNRCYQPCGNWYAGNPRIAPPPTYSLNIPSVAQNQQPYYTPNGSTPTTGATTNNEAWRRYDGSNNNGTNNLNSTSGQSRFVESGSNLNTGQSVLTPGNSPTFSGSASLTRSASNTSLPASGTSFTDSRNFASTLNDERTDPTRMPVTNATLVQAPAQSMIGGQVNQTYALNGTYQPTYSASGVLSQSPGQYPQQYYNYGATPTLVTNGVPFVQPGANLPAPAINNTASSGNVGWRGRELSSDRF